MTLTGAARDTSRRAASGRRAGYVVAAIINIALLWVINVRPGWQSVSWVTAEATDVVPWITAALAASAAVNVLYLVRDTELVRSAGDLVSSTLSLVSSIVVWRVFPFDLEGGWLVLVQVLVVVATVGSAVAVVANVIRTIRAIVKEPGPPS